LSFKAKKLIEDSKNKKFVSIASIWEVAIKIGLKKLFFDGNISEVAELIEKMDFKYCKFQLITQLLMKRWSWFIVIHLTGFL
jgi:PIN domain nuclease of toxin-antitoxin system